MKSEERNKALEGLIEHYSDKSNFHWAYDPSKVCDMLKAVRLQLNIDKTADYA